MADSDRIVSNSVCENRDGLSASVCERRDRSLLVKSCEWSIDEGLLAMTKSVIKLKHLIRPMPSSMTKDIKPAKLSVVGFPGAYGDNIFGWCLEANANANNTPII